MFSVLFTEYRRVSIPIYTYVPDSMVYRDALTYSYISLMFFSFFAAPFGLFFLERASKLVTTKVTSSSLTVQNLSAVFVLTCFAVSVWLLLRPLIRAFGFITRSQYGVDSAELCAVIGERVSTLGSWCCALVAMAPHSVTISVSNDVDDNLWRRAVNELLGRVDAVVLDVSEMSKALAWEIERANEIRPGRVVLIADNNHITKFSGPEGGAILLPEPLKSLWAEVLAEYVLLYDSNSDRRGKKFGKKLLERLRTLR